jgi:hypothetical protein
MLYYDQGDQGQGFPSTQPIFVLLLLFFIYYMFRSYDHLQVEIYIYWRLIVLTTDPLFLGY